MTFFENQGNPMWNNGFMDAINIVSFLIGLQNLELNVTAADLDKQTNVILSEVHRHLKEQDDHLEAQDERIENIERIFSKYVIQERRNKNGQISALESGTVR